MGASELPNLDELLKLDPEVRLEVIRVLWNSLINGAYAPPLTEYQRQILEQRLEDCAKNPTDEYTLDEVEQLLGKRDRGGPASSPHGA